MALASDLVQSGFSSKQADLLGSTCADNITATGILQATAYQLTSSINHITTTVAGVNDGVILPSILTFPKDTIVVRNAFGPGALQIYPAVGEYINATAVNTPYALGVSGVTFYKCTQTASRWISVP